jgi:16S rRNA (uracil1498-N3)-methyltransferase
VLSAGPPPRRFFVPNLPPGGEVTVAPEVAHRLTRVLRLGPGDRVDLFDGAGRSVVAELTAVERRGVRLRIAGEPRLASPPPDTRLICGLMRPARFEWLLEKATELGVTVLQPVVTDRGAVRPDEVGAERQGRWQRIVIEAAEQCGRAWLPEVRPPLPLAGAVRAAAGTRLLVAAEPAHGPATPTLAAMAGVSDAPVAIVTGPEGGLTGAELAALAAAGGQTVGLGPLVLRAETAALAALAVLSAAREHAPPAFERRG